MVPRAPWVYSEALSYPLICSLGASCSLGAVPLHRLLHLSEMLFPQVSTGLPQPPSGIYSNNISPVRSSWAALSYIFVPKSKFSTFVFPLPLSHILHSLLVPLLFGTIPKQHCELLKAWALIYFISGHISNS